MRMFLESLSAANMLFLMFDIVVTINTTKVNERGIAECDPRLFSVTRLYRSLDLQFPLLFCPPAPLTDHAPP